MKVCGGNNNINTHMRAQTHTRSCTLIYYFRQYVMVYTREEKTMLYHSFGPCGVVFLMLYLVIPCIPHRDSVLLQVSGQACKGTN